MEATKNAGLFKGALITLQGLASQALGTTEQGQLEAQARVTSKRITELTDNIASYEKAGGSFFGGLAKSARDELGDLQKSAAQTSTLLKAIADRKQFGDHPITIDKGQGTAAPGIKTKGPDTASAELRKRLDGELKAIRDFANEQRDILDFSGRLLQGEYNDATISLQNFFDDQSNIRKKALANDLAEQDKIIAAERAFAAQTTKPTERIDAENKIAEAVRKKTALIVRSGQGRAIGEPGQRARSQSAC